MNNNIMSVQECKAILDNLKLIKKHFQGFFDNFNKSIDLINKNEIVQSFYASGTLGKEKQKQMMLISDAIKKYQSIVDNGDASLIPKTEKIIQTQMAMLNSKAMMMNGTNRNATVMTSEVQ